MWSLALLATAAFGCSKLNTGRCDQNSDCASNVCTLSTKTCVLVDGGTGGTAGIGGNGAKGGAGGAAGSHAGTGGKPFSCADTKCADGTPICDMDAGACKGCETSSACKTLNAMTPVCVTTAADAASSPPVGECVGCLANTDCGGGTPVCNQATTTCVGCLTTADCRANSPKTPVCNQAMTTCIACGSDSDCTGIGAAICMPDGHCAGDAEVIFVDESVSSCPTANGSSGSPYCTLASAVNVLGLARPVVVILGGTGDRLSLATTGLKPVIIGRKNLAGDAPSILASNGTAVQISSDSVLVRDISLTSGNGSNSKGVALTNSATVTLLRVSVSLGTGLGVDAESGTTLQMTACTVKNNSGGGILLNEAAFDIENTTVTGNGPGSFGTSTLGGILVNNATAVSGTTQIGSTTISNNNGPGLTCAMAITGSNVLAFSNSPLDIAPICGVTTCPDAGATCGAH